MVADWMSTWEKTLDLANGWLTGVGKAQEATLTAATRHLELMAHTYARLWGGSTTDVLSADNRFEDAAWQREPGL